MRNWLIKNVFLIITLIYFILELFIDIPNFVLVMTILISSSLLYIQLVTINDQIHYYFKVKLSLLDLDYPNVTIEQLNKIKKRLDTE